ncbi:UDP-N-acetylmuramoylalanyl-D-glutamate--2,6-diaminopimelate ligase [Carnobacterium iners]|uniref:UDP-N-acetylmuramoylalanyl-D-glutamate--2,6-diaminopimelate ligase n=1 Tax=Carnobacterium iners TaxID=1073423 RepID=A0A1X7MTH5_9LACT|nr:UDP-N-acetylmuramoyl-L-alanyl-D-glutamate--2,6-diaminopimelate ligase [Carnobacterium iners]SEK57052.1 UDP-N-acetylmuramoylalanyl-D-glutamate--2,6-diaminopimelate ligase [Carnobacterium iners]SMH28129.1 UDP-N-acetylmuramoylalanyl-D-glutamate--2,6-diaminopimelate ligase [Carnobacterium iners]
MKLTELIKHLHAGLNEYNSNLKITGIVEDSSYVLPGNIFVAISGNDQDGHHFIQDSINKGAIIIVGEHDQKNLSVPYIQVDDSREALGELLYAFYRDPFKNKKIIGVTGTNGKTTTTYFIKHLLEKHGYSVGLIGTIGSEINGIFLASSNTTPSASTLYNLFNQSNDDVILMEVSSHGLVQKRLHKIPFDFALFTNLQKDHLDYHETMDNYFHAKSILFTKLRANGISIVQGDTPWGKKLLKKLALENKKIIRVGCNVKSTFRVYSDSFSEKGFMTKENDTYINITSPLPGNHNIENLSMALATVQQLGVPINSVNTYLKDFKGVPGRFEQYILPNNIGVVIDYAHTSESVDSCLRTVARLTPNGNLFSIFGFTGKRDKTKRQFMLEKALLWSKKVYLTTDELHGVPMNQLKKETTDIVDSLFSNEPIVIDMDRTMAFEKALKDAQAGDFIVLMGMGHEKYQTVSHYPVKSDKELVDYFNTKLT